LKYVSGPIRDFQLHFTARLDQLHSSLPNLDINPQDDAPIWHDTHWTARLCVTGANLIRHVTRIVRARQGLCLTCVTGALHSTR